MNPNAEPIDSSNHGEPPALTPTDAPPPVPGTLTEPPPLPLTQPPLPPPAKPRVWLALAVGVGAGAAGLVLSVIVMVAVMSLKGVNFQTAFGDKNLAHLLSDPEMLFAMFLPGQCVFLLAAFAAAALSRQPQRQRLGFLRSRMSGWAIPLFILATPFAGLVGGWLATFVFGESSKHLKLMGDVVSGQRGPMVAAVVFLMVVLAPFAEETLFRGYVLRRLLERWRPAAAIGVSALIFTAAHLDPCHMLGVLPIGVWFGVIAWRTGAVWPGMLCHAAQNLLATIGMFSSKHSNQPTDYSNPTVLAMFGFFFLAFAAAAAVLARKQPPARIQNAPETGGPSPQSASHK